MNILINHCWCSDSIWGGNYGCRVIVGINMVQEGKTYYDPHEPDWLNLLEKHPYEKTEFEGTQYARTFTTDVLRLKQEVVNWLNENVKNRDSSHWGPNEHKQGWAVGTDKYNSTDRISFSLFFERRNDAMKYNDFVLTIPLLLLIGLPFALMF